MKPLIIIVGADKGGVGKTQVCRTIDAYFSRPDLKELPLPDALDGQYPRGDLVQFLHRAQIVNLTEVSDQMKIFDTLDGIKLVDVPAGQLGTMLHACDDAMLFEEVRKDAVTLALLHVLGPSVSSMDEIEDAIRLLGADAKHFIVKNHINETNFFEWDEHSKYAASLRALANVTIDVPHLNTVANEAVQQAKMPFVEFMATEVFADGRKNSRTLRGHVGKYLKTVFAEFDRVGLGQMIQDTFR